MKSLILIAVLLTAAVVNAQSDVSSCYFDPIEACRKCLHGESYNQYAVDECDCNVYYHCEITRGTITAHRQTCDACHCFSKDTWGCTEWIKDDPSCHQELFTEVIRRPHDDCCERYGEGPEGFYKQSYKRVTDRPDLIAGQDLYYYWIVFGWPFLMPCPDGTYFDLDKCQCLHCYSGHPTGCVLRDTLVFCLDFENDGSERGIWYNQGQTCSVQPSSYNVPAAHSLHMPGSPCTVEIPYFQNNEFSEFTLCGWFNAASIAPGNQGLAFNGGFPDCYPGSIEISLHGNTVYGAIKTDTAPHTYSITGGSISAGTWHRVCLVYDGSTLDLLLDGVSVAPPVAAHGVTLRNKCNFMLGANFDLSGTQNFFVGEIDHWCFWRTAHNPPGP